MLDALWVLVESPTQDTLFTLKLVALLACFAHWRISSERRRFELELEKAALTAAAAAHAD